MIRHAALALLGEMVTQPAFQAEELERALAGFRGAFEQTPPPISAKKIAGTPAYKLARKGEKVDLPSRKVKIENFEIISYKYPLVRLRADVSSGTYIRSLARTVGEKLGTGAYCTQIVRTRIGEFELKDAQPVD